MTHDTSNHHHTAHERFYLTRRLEFLDRAKTVAEANDALEWEYLCDEFADVCDGAAFLDILKTRCGFASSSAATTCIPLQAGRSVA